MSKAGRSGKVGKILSQCIFYIALVLILLIAVFLFVRGKKQEPTFVFGRSFLWVETGSMSPTIEEKSYILVERSDGTGLQVGDVIVFVCRDASQPVYGSLITHRITEVTDGGYRTKGDNVLSTEDPWTVAPGDVVAVYRRGLGFLTVIARVFSSPVGLILIAVLFFGLCGFLYIPSMVKTYREEEQKEKDEELARRVAEEVARMERENGKTAAHDGGEPGNPADGASGQTPDDIPSERPKDPPAGNGDKPPRS